MDIETLKVAGQRLKDIRENSYDQETFEHDLDDCINLMLKGELLPYPVIECVGRIFVNPKFNAEYAKPHKYEHSDGYPPENHICVCGKDDSDPVHIK